jgi:membrane protease YdiL (CAAX protease family)
MTGIIAEAKDVVTTVAVPHHEPPSVVRRRRIVVVVILVLGAVVLSFSLRSTPGQTSFYWLTLLLAAVWTVGAFASGPLHLGCIRWRSRNQRPVITGSAIGLVLGGAFVVGGFVAREIAPVRDLIIRVLAFSSHGSLWLFFRGALYTALGRFYPTVFSTVGYVAATLASGNLMLGFAAIILGVVCALERRATGGVLAPVLTHLIWGLVMVLALPPIFGL